eukprot:Ihof_evm1s562 gene=Ihof_evmTU1s562
MSKLEVHRCRFVDYIPEAIHCMAFNGDGSLLVVSRSNADIELWNVSQTWTLQQRFVGGENASVEAVAWCGDRLFSAGLHGQITEWNLHSLQPKDTVDSQGGAVWCLATNHSGTRLAVGCEDGCIRLFDIEDGHFYYARTLDRIEGRILSLAWHKDDQVLVSGSSLSTINLWNANTGRTTLRITVEDFHKESTLVWSVALLRDFTIISGDSLGTIQFWDGKFGALKQSHKAHQADVLTMVVNEDETRLFASGVDSKIVQFSLVTVAELDGRVAKKWVQTAKARVHTHDLRALALAPSPSTLLVSGGVDTQVVVYDCNNIEGSTRKIPPYLHHQFISLASQAGLMLCQYPRKLQVWRLGSANVQETTMPGPGDWIAAPMTTGPKLLLEFQPKSKGNFVSSGISPNGSWLVTSDMYNTRLFKALVSAKGGYEISKVKDFALATVATHSLTFTTDNQHMILAGSDGVIRVISLTDLTVVASFDEQSATGPVTRMAVSEDGNWLAAGDTGDNVHLYNLSTYEHQGVLPKSGSYHVCFGFQPITNYLVVAYATHQVQIFDPITMALTEWSRNNSNKFPAHYLRKYPKTTVIAFDPARPNCAILADHTSFTRLDFDQDMSDTYSKAVRSALVRNQHRKGGAKEAAVIGQDPAAVPNKKATLEDIKKQLFT